MAVTGGFDVGETLADETAYRGSVAARVGIPRPAHVCMDSLDELPEALARA